MTHCRKRGYALIYMLSLLPLAAVAGNIAIQVMDHALRAQRMATRHAVDRNTTLNVVRLIRRDAAAARHATGSSSAFVRQLQLSSADRIVRYAYEAEDRTLSRTVQIEDETTSTSHWTFRRGDIGLRVETLETGRQVVWVRRASRSGLQKYSEQSWWMSTSVAVDLGGAR